MQLKTFVCGVLCLGLGSACVDTEKLRPYACQADASVERLRSPPDCLPGQVCGLEGFCRTADASGPFRCDRQTGFGCGAGWFCGLDGQCRAPDAGGPFACQRFDADGGAPPPGVPENDCGSSQWRCGVDGRCQKLGEARAYLCEADPDCEGGWRCGAEKRCLDPSRDELLPSSAGTLGLTVLNPISVKSSLPDFAIAGTFPRLFAAGLTDGGLWWSGETGAVEKHPLPDPEIQRQGPIQFGLTSEAVYLLGASGLEVHQFPGNQVESFSQLQGASLRTAGGRALAFGEDGLWVSGAQSDGLRVAPGLYPPVADVKLVGLTDATVLESPDGLEQCILVAHDGGLAIGRLEQTFPVFSRVPDSTFIEGSDLRLSQGNGPLLAVYSEHGADGGQAPRFSLAEVSWGKRGGMLPPETAIAIAITIEAAPQQSAPSGGWVSGPISYPEIDTIQTCAGSLIRQFENCASPCSPQAPVDFRPVKVGVESALQVVCRNGNQGGNQLTVYRLSGAGCTVRVESSVESGLLDGVQTVKIEPQQGSVRGKNGQLWAIRDWSRPDPVFLDRPASARLSTDGGAEYFLADPYLAKPSPAGLRAFDQVTAYGEKVLAAVEGAPSWFIGESRRVRDLDLLSPSQDGQRIRIKLSADDFGPPIRAQQLGPAESGLFVVTVRDTLLATLTSSGTVIPDALPRLVPQARAEILSFALTPAAAGTGTLASGLLLTTGGLFSITAEAVNRWRSTELLLPSADPIEVWMDGARGRVGTSDGTVYSVPSRVPIADPILSGETPVSVVDYAVLCGEPFALTDRGLYRLEAGTPKGRWQLVPELGGAVAASLGSPEELDEQLLGGRLVPGPSRLTVFTRSGSAFVLEASASCAP